MSSSCHVSACKALSSSDHIHDSVPGMVLLNKENDVMGIFVSIPAVSRPIPENKGLSQKTNAYPQSMKVTPNSNHLLVYEFWEFRVKCEVKSNSSSSDPPNPLEPLPP